MLDGNDSIRMCLDAQLVPAAFFAPSNRLIFEKLVEVYEKSGKKAVPIEILAEELKVGGQLEEIGGLRYLMQISSRVPTTAQTGYFIERVNELHTLRQLIRLSTAAVEQCYDYRGEMEDFIGQLLHDFSGVARSARRDRTWQVTPFTSFRAPPAQDNSILLGKFRYLCRGGVLLLVGPSHVGKSSACFQWAATAALGIPMLGKIPVHGNLRSLVINGEDDEGDVGEVWESVYAEMQLTDAQRKCVEERVLCVEARMETGEQFFAELARAAAKFKPDIVWINPLLAFAGLDLTKPGEVSKLRAMLNQANPEGRFAYVLVHHTNKPPGAAEKKVEKNWNEWMYQMTGAADMTNLARAVVLIEAKKEKKEFVWRLAKRGPRAGVIHTLKADPDEGRAVDRIEVVTEIHTRHSSKWVKLEDGRKIPMIFWEFDEEGQNGASVKKEPESKSNKGGRNPAHTFSDFRDAIHRIAKGFDNRKGFNALHRACQQVKPIGKNAFTRVVDDAVADNILIRAPDGYYL